MELEIQNLRVYRYNFCNNYDDAKDYYDNTLNKAADFEDQRPKATVIVILIGKHNITYFYY